MILLRRPASLWLAACLSCLCLLLAPAEGRLTQTLAQQQQQQVRGGMARSTIVRATQEVTTKSKGKGGPNPGPGDDTDEPEEDSPAPTPAPSVSAAPSTSASPSSVPTVSAAPSDSPSAAPSTTPTGAPSVSPSGTPSTLPSSPPSLSSSPTQFPYTTSNDNTNDSASYTSECATPVPAEGISAVSAQLFAFHYQVQVLTANSVASTLNEAVGVVEERLHALVAARLLNDCTYATNPSYTLLDSYNRDTITDVSVADDCPDGRVCWVVQADLVAHLFYYLPDTDTRNRKSRSLQDELEITAEIEDSSLLASVGGVLRDSLAGLDTGDDLLYKFTGFTNAAIDGTTGDTDQAGDRDNGGIASIQEDFASSDDNKGAISALAVAAAAVVLVAVMLLSVQRRRDHNLQSKSLQHIALEEEYYEDEYDTASDEELKSNGRNDFHDRELPSNNNHATQDILADLASLAPDQEDASYSGSLASYRSNKDDEGSAVSSTYRKVYVLSDASHASPNLGMEGFELPAYSPNRYNDSPSVGPMFIKTEASLRSAMQDLNASHAPLTSRAYGADDTVNL